MQVEIYCVLTVLAVVLAMSCGWPMTPTTVVPPYDDVGGLRDSRWPVQKSLSDTKGAEMQHISSHLHVSIISAIAMMFVRLSVCLSGTGVHYDHTMHFSADLSLRLDSPMFRAP